MAPNVKCPRQRRIIRNAVVFCIVAVLLLAPVFIWLFQFKDRYEYVIYLLACIRSVGVTGESTGHRYYIGMQFEEVQTLFDRQLIREACDAPSTWPESKYYSSYVVQIGEDDLLLEFNRDNSLICIRRGLAFALKRVAP